MSGKGKGGRGKAKGGKSTSRSAKAGLQFPVGRIASHLKKGRYAKRVGGGAPVYLAAVLEYLAAEILELAGPPATTRSRASTRTTSSSRSATTRNSKAPRWRDHRRRSSRARVSLQPRYVDGGVGGSRAVGGRRGRDWGAQRGGRRRDGTENNGRGRSPSITSSFSLFPFLPNEVAPLSTSPY